MLNKLIITVAGTSSRFSQSIGKETLKSIYYESPYNKSILEVLLEYAKECFDDIIIVGGYRFEDLQQYLTLRLREGNISCVYNDHFADYGSNYSLYLGLQKALEDEDCNVVFVEGDLIIDKHSFDLVCKSKKSVITSNNTAISADKSVIFYSTTNGIIKYAYDSEHKELFISEPFTTIANSGQIWKFTHSNLMRIITDEQSVNDFKDNNLNIVQKYFQRLTKDQYCVINIKQWYNCNAAEDYRIALQSILQ